ncbi:ANGPT1 [Mytilus edulis]|uniref:ANGPT1 n=1 Tax=Mytilus edulis TaxID=6550 RepID=A0A8S3VBR9_MYTED|nr:ANGPT1 [Mytilus edulis]
MVIIIIIYGVVVINPICHGTSDIKKKMKFILEKEEIIVSSDSTTTTKADSVIQCTTLCTSEQECETASYDRTTGQCRLDSNSNPQTKTIKTGILVFKNHEPTDCSKMPNGSINGVYKIFVNNVNRYLDVYCDMTAGGWTVIQRRQDGSVDFYRDWLDYKKGFGNVSGEYWLGNDNIFNILNGKSYSLRFDLERSSGERSYAQYEIFKIADESEDYNLTLAGYSGTAAKQDLGPRLILLFYLSKLGDANANRFAQLSGQLFSTKDRDNDNWDGGNALLLVKLDGGMLKSIDSV